MQYHSYKYCLLLAILFQAFGLSLQTYGQTYLSEDFSSGQMPPPGWSIDNVSGQWTANPSANAGGQSPEARFQWIQLVDVTKLISPPIDLSGLTSVMLKFNHMYDYYQGEGPSIGFATRSNNGVWTSIWQLTPEVNIGPETVELEITNDDVGQPNFQVCCYILGDLYNLDYWYVDNIILYQSVHVQLKAWLEGPFDGDEMSNTLNVSGYMPLSQPYGVWPWKYNGDETVGAIPNEMVADWILVEFLEKDPYIPQKYNSLMIQAGFILQDGSITGLDGSSPMEVDISGLEDIHIRIHHRNHLSMVSSGTLQFSNGTYFYDFSGSSTQVYHGKKVMKEMSDHLWGVAAGDASADGVINNKDKNDFWRKQYNSIGYHSGDFNMDGIVDETDIDSLWIGNAGKSSWMPDTAEIQFTCGDTLLDTRDGNQYSTIEVGDQCWIQENLNYDIGTNWCYNNNTAYCEVFGRLYNWTTIMNGSPGSSSDPSGVQGICPQDWHIPSDAEWCTLLQFVDESVDCDYTGYNGTDAGLKLKSTWGWSTDGNGTDDYGFTALPGGCMGIYHFDDVFLFSYFWSTTEDYPGYAWLIKLNYGLPTAARYFSTKNRGYSVRCLKD